MTITQAQYSKQALRLIEIGKKAGQETTEKFKEFIKRLKEYISRTTNGAYKEQTLQIINQYAGEKLI